MKAFDARFNKQLVSAYKLVMRVEELMLRDLSGNDLTISEMHLMESIAGGGAAGMHITDIALDQGTTLPTVTTSVQRLERKGYVMKQRNALDARRVCATLTEKGRRAEIAHRYFHRQMVRAILDAMSAPEQQATLSGLTKLNEFLSEKIAAHEVGRGDAGGER